MDGEGRVPDSCWEMKRYSEGSIGLTRSDAPLLLSLGHQEDTLTRACAKDCTTKLTYDLTGRKEIMAFLKLASWAQVKARLAKGMPVIREAGCLRWMACSTEMVAWVERGRG